MAVERADSAAAELAMPWSRQRNHSGLRSKRAFGNATVLRFHSKRNKKREKEKRKRKERKEREQEGRGSEDVE